jgi:hypothetical protein
LLKLLEKANFLIVFGTPASSDSISSGVFTIIYTMGINRLTSLQRLASEAVNN